MIDIEHAHKDLSKLRCPIEISNIRHFRQAFTGAHHQWTHGAEVLFALAFSFDFIKLDRKLMMIYFATLNLAMWLNGLAYAMAALSGVYLFEKDKVGSGFWFQTEWLLLYVTALFCMICFPLLILGLYQTKPSQDAHPAENDAAHKKAK